MSRPGPPRGTSGRSSNGPTSAPLRVVAERLSADEARVLRDADAAAFGWFGTHPAPTADDAVADEAIPGPLAADAGWGPATTALAAPRAVHGTIAASVARDRFGSSLPAPSSAPPRRSGFGELLALLRGRRRAGRHRPDTVHRHAWSMFAPQRRQRRQRRRRWATRARH